jgi:hypothetical protein
VLYTGAFVSAVAALVAPAELLGSVPRWIVLLGAFLTATLPTGLLLRQRWAWFATLAFVAVNAYYLFLGATVRGDNILIGGSVLAVVAGYLLWPDVRAAFLRNGRNRQDAKNAKT